MNDHRQAYRGPGPGRRSARQRLANFRPCGETKSGPTVRLSSFCVTCRAYAEEMTVKRRELRKSVFDTLFILSKTHFCLRQAVRARLRRD